MRKIKIITDSCADLSSIQLKKYNIDYVRMSIMKDSKEHPALLTWSDEEAHELYETIRGRKRITTAQVAVDEFNRVFGKYLDEGYDIVYIACSSKQSGSINTSHVTAQKLLHQYPGAQISCVKPILVCDANGAQAAYKKVKGRRNSLQEIVSLLKENITDAEQQTVFIAHADCPKEEVEYLKNLVKKRNPLQGDFHRLYWSNRRRIGWAGCHWCLGLWEYCDFCCR